MKLPTIRSERFAVAVRRNGTSYKIFQIVFHTGRDSGSTHILIDFPYFTKTQGLLSRSALPANQSNSFNLSLLPEGRVTTKRIKYSHPMSGKAHFSGDGQIIKKLENQSKRLDATHGHLATIQVQGIEDFQIRMDKKLGPKKTDLDFEFTDDITGALKFVIWWSKVTDIKGILDRSQPLKPQFGFRDADSKIREQGFIVSPPVETPIEDFAMLVSCQGIPLIKADGSSALSFIGGFDEDKDPAKDLHFLACIYPPEDFDSLLKQLGSVDFNPKNPLAST